MDTQTQHEVINHFIDQIGGLAHIDGINALICDADVLILKKYAALVSVEDGLCVEFGSAEGASAWSILQTLPPQYDLVCCSLHWAEDYRKFRALMVRCNLWDRVIPITSDFRECWQRIASRPIKAEDSGSSTD